MLTYTRSRSPVTVADNVIVINCPQRDIETLLNICLELIEYFPEKQYELEKLYTHITQLQQQQEKPEKIMTTFAEKLRHILHRTIILRHTIL